MPHCRAAVYLGALGGVGVGFCTMLASHFLDFDSWISQMKKNYQRKKFVLLPYAISFLHMSVPRRSNVFDINRL
jgi:hypothetical protein